MKYFALLAILCGLTVMAHGATISVFANNTYVDADSTGFTDEVFNVRKVLQTLGHNETTFTGITAADWNAAFDSADMVHIAELERGVDLGSDLSSSARTAIADQVANGKGLIIHAFPSFAASFLNNVFGFNTTENNNSNSGSITLTSEATGTAFANGPSSITNFGGHNRVIANLPSESKVIYKENSDNSVVLMQHGAGKIVYLGYDFAGSFTDASTRNGGWYDVLDNSVIELTNVNNTSVAAVPESNSLALLLFAALSVLGYREKWRRK